MAEHVKIHLKDGSREIVVEGSREDIDELLARWWIRSSDVQSEQDKKSETAGTGKGRIAGRRRRSGVSTPAEKNGTSSFDPQPIVNAMRDHEQHGLWETKVLHAKSALNKIMLVCWFTKQHRTSGEIQAVLDGLGVKMGLPQVSNCLKDNLSNFLQDGARSKGAVVRYKLTGKAEKDFEAWLNTNE